MRLYHFTLPVRLPEIFKTGALMPDATSPHGFMTGGVPAVWLTSGGNEIDRATIRHFRKLGLDDLLKEIENGRRLMFAADVTDEGGSARIALRLPKRAVTAGALVPYLPWVRTEMGVETWRHFRSRLSCHAADWWLAFAPDPGRFASVDPVGGASRGYVAAVEKIHRSKRRRAQCVIAEAHA